MSGFAANYARGFKITFENGWTVSIVWGPGSYSSNYDAPFEGYREKIWEAETAEVWSWNDAGKNKPEQPIGYQTPEDVAAFIAKTQRRKRKEVVA